MPQQMSISSRPPTSWSQTIWPALLVATSVALSLGFACAVPFAAFGAAAALTMQRRDALLLAAAIWLANQVVGFTVLDYPLTASTFVWGAVLGVVAVLTTAAAQSIAGRLDERGRLVVLVAAFAGGFIVYEGCLYLVSATWLGGSEIFVPAIVTRILEINAAAFVGLLVLNRIAGAVGLTRKPAFT
jgi:hypothetical protein